MTVNDDWFRNSPEGLHLTVDAQELARRIKDFAEYHGGDIRVQVTQIENGSGDFRKVYSNNEIIRECKLRMRKQYSDDDFLFFGDNLTIDVFLKPTFVEFQQRTPQIGEADAVWRIVVSLDSQ